MKLSDYVAEYLVNKTVKYNYIFTGGAIAHLIDSCWLKHQEKPDYLRPICVLHEQAGSMAMDAYTRVTGELAVMMVTSGPGATNLLTGIACSYYDSIPGIYFTGQVRTWEYTGKGPQRQLGFQETDIVSMAKPVCKYAVQLDDANDIKFVLDKAFYLAQEGRPGPVLIDLPMDLQWAEVDPENLRGFVPPEHKFDARDLIERGISSAVEIIANSKRPLIVSGGGVRNAGAVESLREFSQQFSIPTIVSFGGKDSYSHDSELFAGLLGTMGNKGANESINESDCLIVIGSRLSWRQIRARPDKFAKTAKIIHVDIDASEINQQILGSVALPVDAKDFIECVSKSLGVVGFMTASDWVDDCRTRLKNNSFPSAMGTDSTKEVNPYYFFKTLSEEMGLEDIAVIDAGQNVMWGMQALEPRGSQRVITAWGHSPMGYSLPAAIGPALHYAGTDKNVICAIGDGGFQVNIQELQTIKYYNIPVKIFILNNHCYGAIKDFQDGNLDSRYFGTVPGLGYEAPDMLAIAKSYGLSVLSIRTDSEVRSTIKEILSMPGPVVVDVDLGSDTQVVLDPI